ncbi:MAG: hypothetical protein NTU53_03380 [Planctomycetota bacterium]|nr:hypothetical protein [Planctomycetota bacterium]
MKLLFALVIVFTAIACDKTIHECRVPQNPQPNLSTPSSPAPSPA